MAFDATGYLQPQRHLAVGGTHLFKSCFSQALSTHLIMSFAIVEADPQGPDAYFLLREAAIEAGSLYPELHQPDAPWPTNEPTPPRGSYLIAYKHDVPVGMVSHCPWDEITTEIRRMYVLKSVRRLGIASALLQRLENDARSFGFTRFVLETGYRQVPAMKLYEANGFVQIPPFGKYRDDPTSICYAKNLAPTRSVSHGFQIFLHTPETSIALKFNSEGNLTEGKLTEGGHGI